MPRQYGHNSGTQSTVENRVLEAWSGIHGEYVLRRERRERTYGRKLVTFNQWTIKSLRAL